MKNFALTILLLGTPALAAAPAKSLPAAKDLATLGLIDAESDESTTTVTVRLEEKPSWTKPRDLQDHGTFLQLVLPSVIVPEPGKFFEGSGPHVKKIAVFQLTPSDAGVRIFVEGSAAKVKAATTLELLDKRIVLSMSHADIPAPDAPLAFVGPPAPVGPPVPEAGKDGSSADAIIAKTVVRHDPKPSDLIKKDKGGLKLDQAAAGGFDLRGKLIQVAMFLGGMIVLMVLALAVKPYLRHRRAKIAGFEEQPLTMKTLATLPLAARQKVSVIQVGDEKILIGVTPENVTFLTTIGKSQPQQQFVSAPLPARVPPTFSKMLADGATQGEVELRPRAQIPASKPAPAPAPKVQAQLPEETRPAPKRPRAEGASGKGSKINIAVGDDGVQDLGRPTPPPPARKVPVAKPAAPAPAGEQAAIDDVTKMIREKLRSLRSIT